MISKLDIEIDVERLVSDFTELNLEKLLFDNKRQYCIQKRVDTSDRLEYLEGSQSLEFDWEGYDPKIHKTPKLRVPFLKQEQFSETCTMYKGTYLGELTEYFKSTYDACRGRFMMLDWKTCLTYHWDKSPRLHVPIVTNNNCFMVIEDEVIRLPLGGAYIVDTRLKHTAINASKENRTHLVFCLPVDHIDS